MAYQPRLVVLSPQRHRCCRHWHYRGHCHHCRSYSQPHTSVVFVVVVVAIIIIATPHSTDPLVLIASLTPFFPRLCRCGKNSREKWCRDTDISNYRGVSIIAYLTGLVNPMHEKIIPPERKKGEGCGSSATSTLDATSCFVYELMVRRELIEFLPRAIKAFVACQLFKTVIFKWKKEWETERKTDIHGDRNEVERKWISSVKIGLSEEDLLVTFHHFPSA